MTRPPAAGWLLETRPARRLTIAAIRTMNAAPRGGVGPEPPAGRGVARARGRPAPGAEGERPWAPGLLRSILSPEVV